MTVLGPGPGGVTCALEGCDIAIVRPGRGGRPKLYCSDAHRSLARRRRLRQAPSPDDMAGHALEALRQAVALVDQALSGRTERQEAAMADARAQATTQVLAAQRQAADATGELARLRARYEKERLRWDAERTAAEARTARDQAVIEELRAALDGARTELEAELLRHHRDLQDLEDERSRRGGA